MPLYILIIKYTVHLQFNDKTHAFGTYILNFYAKVKMQHMGHDTIYADIDLLNFSRAQILGAAVTLFSMGCKFGFKR